MYWSGCFIKFLIIAVRTKITQDWKKKNQHNESMNIFIRAIFSSAANVLQRLIRKTKQRRQLGKAFSRLELRFE